MIEINNKTDTSKSVFREKLVNTGILISEGTLSKIDEKRGRFSRSAFIEETVKKSLEEEEHAGQRTT